MPPTLFRVDLLSRRVRTIIVFGPYSRFVMPEPSAFKNFVAHRLSAAHFEPNPTDPESNLFHLSLESARVLFGWTKGRRSPDGAVFELHAGFVDVMRPNALADAWQGRHFIALHTSLFAAITEFAMFCFTQKDFFLDIGNPAVEVSPQPWDGRVPGIWLLDVTTKGGQVTEAQSRQLIARDSERFVASLYLGQLMARVVWLHELAHCINGHVGYVQRRGLVPRLYELADPLSGVSVDRTRPLAEKADILRCLELDADRAALRASCSIQLNSREPIEGIAALEAGQRIRLTLFGALAMIWLIDAFQDYLDSQNVDSHPTPSLRLQNLLRTLASEIRPLHAGMAGLIDDVLQQFDVVRAAIPSMYGNADLAARIRDGPLMEELRALGPLAADVDAQLRAFAYGAPK